MRILALDVGTKRVGLAFADTAVRIAVPRGMVPVDGNELANIAKNYRLERADCIVSGSPRNNSGEETRQTASVREFIDNLKSYFAENMGFIPTVYFQDESYTSIAAEELLRPNRADRKAGAVDAEAATIILQDFLERPDLMKIEEELKNGQKSEA